MIYKRSLQNKIHVVKSMMISTGITGILLFFYTKMKCFVYDVNNAIFFLRAQKI